MQELEHIFSGNTSQQKVLEMKSSGVVYPIPAASRPGLRRGGLLLTLLRMQVRKIR